MRTRLLVCAAVAAIAASAASAQTADYKPPRTSWGVPAFDGVWTNASLTSLQKSSAASAVTVTEEERQRLLSKNRYTLAAQDEAGASKLDRESSDKLLADKNPARGYNTFWMEPGSDYARVGKDIRTAWVTSPANGMIPYKPGKRPGFNVTYDGPEGRPVQERCVSYARLGPVFGNGMYNNNFQIVQTPNHLLINAEMIHEARSIPIFKSRAEAKHGPAALRNFGGDSIAWYEGDTLVVETVNVRQDQRPHITGTGTAIERFTRWKDDEILYQFRVEDDAIYSQPWSGEQVLRASKEQVYEYACHEGNYGMFGILAGARQLEADGREHPPEKPIFAGLDADE
ncbi:MAG: hypothetical protein EON61_08095 [Alphaproteobacteria bacterium]|nr:MAG: hypothetical protein EON61_08095 [Alphaproteobacteria bacterium]